jgi:ribosome-binding factor A
VIGHQVRLKVLPDLEFEEDVSIDSANRIEQLIERLHRDERGQM